MAEGEPQSRYGEKRKKVAWGISLFLHLLPMTKIAQHSVHEFFMFITNSPPYAELHLARLHLASVYEVQRGNINLFLVKNFCSFKLIF